MPLFDYVCRTCHTGFEVLVVDDTEVHCPKCSATHVERLLSLPARPISVNSPGAGTCQAGPGIPPCGPACNRWS